MQATETQDKAVKVPIPWDIINAGGTIIAKGLIFWKLTLVHWANKRSPIIKIVCRELIIGFSFLEISINKPQNKSISKNATNHPNRDPKSFG